MTAVEQFDLSTEAADTRYSHIDTLDVGQLARLMNRADREVPSAIEAAMDRIVPALEAVSARMQQGGRLLYVGAGTPGRLGVLDASEIPPTFSTQDRVIGLIAGGRSAIFEAVEGAEDDHEAGASIIDDSGVGPLDSVIGVTASGRTPYVLGAVERAQSLGALGVGLSCNLNAALSDLAEHAIEVVVGPELISGSTRLKAGTAQKLVLNMFSTIAMIRLGKTYGNLMVDVRASNHKLRERAIRLVSQIAEVDRDQANRALEAADHSVPVAVVMVLRGLDPAAARYVLAGADGRLRDALNQSANTTDGTEHA